MTDSLVSGNRIYNVSPISDEASKDQEGCGINAVRESANARNTYVANMVSNAYCGVAHVTTDYVASGVYINTLYNTLNSDLYPDAYPPATLPE